MYLMHKDKMVAKFNLYKNKPFEFIDIYDENELPIGLRGNIHFASNNLMAWHSRRCIPNGRLNIKEIEQALENYGSIDEVSLSSFGLSLNDTYWYKPENSELSWDTINFRDNEFNESLFELETIDKILNPNMSPDFRTNGALNKMWIISDGRPCLIKSGDIDGITNNSGILAANEIVASQIATLLGLDAVEYLKLNLNGFETNYCISECFINYDEDFVTGNDLLDQFNSKDSNKLYKFIGEKCGFNDELDKMIVLDVLLHNQDRHEDNYGIILDANTGDIKRFAPIFDTGNCLAWNGVIEEDNMKFPKRNRKDCLTKLKSKIELPNINEIKEVITDIYDEFKISEKQIELALADMSAGYDYLQKFNHNPQIGLGFDINSLFEEEI